jgi:hypothetical protein
MQEQLSTRESLLRRIRRVTGLPGDDCRMVVYARMNTRDLEETLEQFHRQWRELVSQVAAEMRESRAILNSYTIKELLIELSQQAGAAANNAVDDSRLRRRLQLASR